MYNFLYASRIFFLACEIYIGDENQKWKILETNKPNM